MSFWQVVQLKTNDSSSLVITYRVSKKVLDELLGQNLPFVIVILGNILDQNLLEHLAFEKDRERMHEGCVTENPFFAFDKVCIFFLM